MSGLSYMNLVEPMLLVLTLLDPNLDSSLHVFACPEVYLILDSLLPTIYHNISNGVSEWVEIPSAIETHTAHDHSNNYNDNVRGKHLSAPLAQGVHAHN